LEVQLIFALLHELVLPFPHGQETIIAAESTSKEGSHSLSSSIESKNSLARVCLGRWGH
jgi:hypothetical protein